MQLWTVGGNVSRLRYQPIRLETSTRASPSYNRLHKATDYTET